jgi:hypothetical protein
MDSLKNEAMALGIANGAISAFEIINGTSGFISLFSGAGTLAYSIYTYYQEEMKAEKNKNFGDDIADLFDLGLDTAEGTLKGLGWLSNNLFLVAGLVGGGVVLYLLSGMVRVQPTTVNVAPSTIPAMLGAGMGLGGSVLLYMSGDVSNRPSDIPHTIAHDAVSFIDGLIPKSKTQRFDVNLTKRIVTEAETLRAKNPNDPQIKVLYDRLAMANEWSKNNPGWTDAQVENYYEYNTQSKAYHYTEDYQQWLANNPDASQSQIDTAKAYFSR